MSAAPGREDRDAARTDNQPEHDQQDPEQDLTLDELHDPDDHEDGSDDSQKCWAHTARLPVRTTANRSSIARDRLLASRRGPGGEPPAGLQRGRQRWPSARASSSRPIFDRPARLRRFASS
jgi:hypothetical protein